MQGLLGSLRHAVLAARPSEVSVDEGPSPVHQARHVIKYFPSYDEFVKGSLL